MDRNHDHHPDGWLRFFSTAYSWSYTYYPDEFCAFVCGPAVALGSGRYFSLAFVALLAAFFNPPDSAVTSPDIEYVQRVIDGDTLLFGTGERVRLIGVATPETKHPNKPVEQFGKEASAFTRRMVEGKRIRLEYDPSNAARGHKDRYGRTLAFIFLEERNAAKC